MTGPILPIGIELFVGGVNLLNIKSIQIHFAAAGRRRSSSLLGLAFSLVISGCGSESPDELIDGELLPHEGERTVGSQHPPKTLNPFDPLTKHLEESMPSELVHARIDGAGILSLTSSLGEAIPTSFSLETPRDLLDHFGVGFSWKKENHHTQTLGLSRDPHQPRVERLQLHFQGIPVKSVGAISRSEWGQTTWLHASIPHWAGQNLVSGWQTPQSATPFSLSAEEALTAYSQSTGYAARHFSEPSKVYVPSKTQLRAAYAFVVGSDVENLNESPSVPLQVYLDADTATVLEQFPIAFHVNGSARIFRENDVASRAEGLQVVVLPDLVDTGSTLSHPLFDVKNCNLKVVSSKCVFSAQAAAGGDFTTVQYESSNYDEVVAYYAITRAMNWFRKLMGSDTGQFAAEKSWNALSLDFGLGATASQRLTVYVRALSAQAAGVFTLDNAVYLPAGPQGISSPEILIGSGWESEQAPNRPRSLQYLGKDADVAMHEFGHHIIYRTITEIRGQSLAMHEGFADYLTYAITGNNKLAEGVVATGASLRSATRRGTLSEYPPATTPPHTAGEFWSTVLWDIRESMGEWKDGFYKFDKIMWHAIDLMAKNESYYGAINALAGATDTFALAAGDDAVKLKETMFAHFYQRGFINAPEGDGALPSATVTLSSSTPPAGLSSSSETPTQEPTRSSSKKSGLFGLSCTVGQHGGQSRDIGLLLLVLLLFAPLARLPRRSPQPVELRSSQRRD